jgi:two-component system chemotaxis sensor kinase CheA
MSLFRPGFSTKETADDVSGRGVGLDAAKDRVESMRGMIALESEKGAGTKVTLWVPLTLAMTRGVLTEQAGVKVVIPLGCVVEVLKLDPWKKQSTKKTGLIEYKDVTMKARNLERILGTGTSSDPKYAVIIGLGERRSAILAERVRGETEIAGRPLPDAVNSPAFISGATQLQDGSPAIIIQPEDLLREATVPAEDYRKTGSEPPPALAQALRDWKRGRLLKMLFFTVGDRLCAAPVGLLSEVIGPRAFCRIPTPAGTWQGLFFARGLCHGLLAYGSPGSEGLPPRKIVILNTPERCGIGVQDIAGDYSVSYRDFQVSDKESSRGPLSVLGTVDWRGNEVRVLDAEGFARSTIADSRRERPAGSFGRG